MPTGRRAALGLLVVMAGGCQVLDALDKLKSVSFMLPTQSYSVSTSDPHWRSPPTSGLPPLPCGAGQPIADCCAPPVDCTRAPLVCEADRCALKFNYEQAKPINLANVMELKQIDGKIISQVLLKEIQLDVNNQMNVTTPPVNIFVAPAKVTSPSAGGAQKIGVIPMQVPGTQGRITVPLDAAAQQAFSSFARDFQTPFNIIMSTTVVTTGNPFPAGHIDFTVGGLVEVKL